MSDKINVLAIIQARMGSTRLPGKVLLDLEGKTVLERVIERVSASKLVDKVLVATTISDKDLPLVELCARLGVSVFCGAENDVLDRFYQAAKLFKPENMVRITADCPLIDSHIIDSTIKLLHETGADYASNQLEEKYPDGLDVEVFTFKALEKAWSEARMYSEREHVTPYIRNNRKIFKIAGLKAVKDHSDKRWTLDNEEDYVFISAVYKNISGQKDLFGMTSVLALMKEMPELEKINNHIKRNEGYAKSLKEDRICKAERLLE